MTSLVGYRSTADEAAIEVLARSHNEGGKSGEPPHILCLIRDQNLQLAIENFDLFLVLYELHMRSLLPRHWGKSSSSHLARSP
jgi:hypothetical protein